MNYRDVVQADAKAVALLHAESWKRTYRGVFRDEFLNGDVIADRLAVWTDRLTRACENQLVMVAEDDSGIVGFVCVYGNEDSSWGSLVDNLHVAHDHKGLGIGAALMKMAGAWLARRYPATGVYLWVLESNESARRFYERLGARNHELVERENRGGGTSRNCRYVWSSPDVLLKSRAVCGA